MTYAVIIIETGSDFPGVEDAFGPFTHYEDASAVADATAARLGAKRGEHVQVTTIHPPDVQATA